MIGAPYDGDGGAIYIYMGSSEGILGKPAQVIRASDVGSNLRTFGWSLSAGMDLDRNAYPDLLIGAYESANAVYLKSAPVVHLNSKVGRRTNQITPRTVTKTYWFLSFRRSISGRRASRSISIRDAAS